MTREPKAPLITAACICADARACCADAKRALRATGKSTLAQQLAARLNLPNVLQTDVIYRVSIYGCQQPKPSSLS